MDVELLFSRNPFVQEISGPFASIRPNATQAMKLPTGQAKLAIPLPKELTSRNVLVEVAAAGKISSHPYYANVMDVRLLESARAIYPKRSLRQLPGPGGRETGASRLRGQLPATGGPQEHL